MVWQKGTLTITDTCDRGLGILACSVLLNGCFVDGACYNDADCSDDKHCVFETGAKRGTCVRTCERDSDCSEGEVCDVITGRCSVPECREETDCRDGFLCRDGRCEAVLPLICPEGMVAVGRFFCIDRYEASRPDADATRAGVAETMATSRAGVMPWQVTDNAEADAACRNAGKSLCTASEWQQACIGPEETVYAYGDAYNPETCNSIDTFCRCDQAGDCGGEETCPFAYCYKTCGADFHLMPTGSFPDCTNGWGLFDINGNLWEHVLGGDDTRIRGGAFNCLDSKTLHRCDYVPGDWTPSARGFRCCAEGTIAGDGGIESEDSEWSAF
jgi:hypothetical protein